MSALRMLLVVVISLAALSGCASDETSDSPGELPTRFNPAQANGADAPAELPTRVADELAASDRAGVSVGATAPPTATDRPPTATPTTRPTQFSGAPTLPPPFTPTPSATSTATAPPAQIEADAVNGVLAFIYNGDSIVTVDPATGQQTLIVTFGVEQPIRDLVVSPDRSLLAFVAPGNGSATEVWISNLDGSFVGQVSCLGQTFVSSPAWHPDGEQIAFIASQTPDEPGDLYITSWVGSGDCPTGNNQRLVHEAQSVGVSGLAFSPDGGALYFSEDATYVYDLAAETLSQAIAVQGGNAPDFAFSFAPQDMGLLTFIRNTSLRADDLRGGDLVGLDVTDPAAPRIVFEERTFITSYDWHPQGEGILVSSPESTFEYDRETRISETIIFGASQVPLAVYSPDGTRIAYVNGTPEQPDVPQIYVRQRRGGTPQAVTQIEEGRIDALVWAAAP